jgi:hypothetical protein
MAARLARHRRLGQLFGLHVAIGAAMVGRDAARIEAAEDRDEELGSRGPTADNRGRLGRRALASRMRGLGGNP